MNLIKALALVIIGAIFGYSFSLIGKVNNDERLICDEVSMADTTLPNITPEFNVQSPINNKNVALQIDCPAVPRNLTTIVKDDEVQTQEYLDLVEDYKVLERKYAKSKNKISTLNHQLSELDESETSNEEMEELAPEPFKSFLSSFRGKTRNDIYDFHKQEDDLDWGYNTQNYISDFIQTHYNGSSVELISVICKQPYCEILVIEKEEDAWKNIMKEIRQQPWWKFSSTTSSSNNMSTYIFLSM
jgi:hypothetical protein